MDNGIEKEEQEMSYRFKFIEFANLVGTISFDNDACYDDCHGWITLVNGPCAEHLIITEGFTGAYERNILMQKAFEHAAKVMAEYAEIQKGF